jgi:hypothetical protein
MKNSDFHSVVDLRISKKYTKQAYRYLSWNSELILKDESKSTLRPEILRFSETEKFEQTPRWFDYFIKTNVVAGCLFVK